MTAKLTDIRQITTDRNGVPLRTRDGRTYTRLLIKTEEHANQWISGFQNKQNYNWKVGDLVNIEIQEVQKDGQTYLNFRTQDRIDLLEARIATLEIQIRNLMGSQEAKKEKEQPEELPPLDEDLPEDLAF